VVLPILDRLSAAGPTRSLITRAAPPQVISEDLAACADVCVATASLTLRLPALRNLCRLGRAELIPGLPDFERAISARRTSASCIPASWR
jgi:hypothetical protein